MEGSIVIAGDGDVVDTLVIVRTGDTVVIGVATATGVTIVPGRTEAAAGGDWLGIALDRVGGSQPDSTKRRRRAKAYLTKRFRDIPQSYDRTDMRSASKQIYLHHGDANPGGTY